MKTAREMAELVWRDNKDSVEIILRQWGEEIREEAAKEADKEGEDAREIPDDDFYDGRESASDSIARAIRSIEIK